MLKITPIETEREPYRSPDLVWDGKAGNLLINPLTHPEAPGDLRAEQGLATQVLICLMTDRRVESSELRHGEQNRGWIGDSFDREAGETPLGSRLWLLRRSAIVDGLEVTVEDYVREALQPLLDQGAAVALDVAVAVNRATNQVDYLVTLYGREGGRVYEQKFEILWRQVDGVADPLAG